ncbi:NAD(P)H-hydrate dehydratase [Xanthobacter sp. TB0139]|uniref:NAD(P)H-hydrate dehydratase n=1 Tax=Xanthobacter sp. TB0139 TaxID=3459178 RepID=UPI0040396378
MHELLNPEQMGRADRQAVAMGVPSLVLMERAGMAVADVAARMCSQAGAGGKVMVLCGPGNNGGDGFVAARLLAARGFPVRLALLGARERLRGDAAENAALWRGPVEAPEALDLAGADVIIDAVFGAGLARDLEGGALSLVQRMEVCGRPIVAVDLPSGLDGATGEVRGAAAAATETVTFFRRKPGHLLEPGRSLCGRVHVADIGIPVAALDEVRPDSFVNQPAVWGAAFPLPQARGHKYDRGHVVVASGGAWTCGAARLAARGALRAGAGLVTVACPQEALPLHAASYAAIMLRPMEDAGGLAHLLNDSRLGTVLLGPGLGVGEETRRKVQVAASGRHLILDADALTSYAGAAVDLAALAQEMKALVITPHDGEFARLFHDMPQVLEAPGKLARARAAAAFLGGVVVLKGADTVVAAPDGRAGVAENAPPFLASAGAGDVLAGMVAGLLSQHMPPFEAAMAAVWAHGEAARTAGPGLIADDLPEALRVVYRRLYEMYGAWGDASAKC